MALRANIMGPAGGHGSQPPELPRLGSRERFRRGTGNAFPKPSKQESVSTGPWVVDNSQRARMPHTLTPKAREKEGGMLRRASALQLTSSPAAYTHPAHQPRLTMSRSSCMWPFMRCALSTARGPSPLRPRQGTIRTMGINFRLPTWITGIGDRDADATAPT